MQQEIRQKNLRLLKKHHRNVYEILCNTNIKPTGSVTLNPSGLPLITVEGSNGQDIVFHDASAPVHEAYEFLSAVPEHERGTVIFIGMGLGYGPLAMAKERPDLRHIVVVEPRLEILAQAINNMDLTDFLARPGSILLAGHNFDVEQALQPVVRAVWIEHTHIFRHVPSFSYHNDYEVMRAKVFEFINTCNIEGATNSRFGRLFFENKLNILPQIPHQHLLESLDGLFRDVPALLVAGGPSLDKNIDTLARAKGKAVIFAGDTVTQALLDKNISPDFITSADYRRITYEKFAATASMLHGDSSLICVSGIAASVPRIFPARHVFWAFIQMYLDKWVCTVSGGKWLTGSVGTMAHLSLFAALKMGCSPIIFVGQDLAYTDNRDHASSTVITTRKRMQQQMKTKQDLLWIKGRDGNMVPTSRALYGHKMQFEAIIKENPGHYINCSTGGAEIAGTENMDIDDALTRFCIKDVNVIAMTDSVTRRASGPVCSSRIVHSITTLRDRAESMKGILNRSDKTLKTGLRKMQSLEKNRKIFRTEAAMPQSVKKIIRQLDESNSKIDAANDIWNILEAVTFRDIREIEDKIWEIDRCSEKPEGFFCVVKKNLERLATVNRSRRNALNILSNQLDSIADFMERERRLEKELERSPHDLNVLKQLGRLYLENEYISRARHVYERIAELEPDSQDIYYGMGVIAMFHHRFDDAWSLFDKITEQGLRRQAEKIISKFGESYFKYATTDDRLDENAVKRMLFRGINADRCNVLISRAVTDYLKNDIDALVRFLGDNDMQEPDAILAVWFPEIESNTGLRQALPNSMRAELFALKGRYEMLSGRTASAISFLEQACLLMPDNRDLLLWLTEAGFGAGRFDTAVDALDKLISIDKEYAAYWEEIGDMLVEQGEHEDAAAAFEKCFTILPQRVHLLKKIGDCYKEMGSLDASLEAYRHYKKMLEQEMQDGQDEATKG